MIPDRVRQAALAAHASSPPPGYENSQAIAGEISVAAQAPVPVSDADLRRLVAVLGRSDVTGTVEILLVANEIENATDLDLIVDPGDAVLPYTAMIQSELYGPLFFEQLQGRVGSINDDLRQAVAGALASDGESLDGHRTGLPLGDFSDPRRAFKASELDDLEQLVSRCRRWLAGESAEVRVLDPELLMPPSVGTSIDDAADQFLELLDVIAEMGDGPVAIPESLFGLLIEDEVNFIDEISRWRTDFGFDTSRVLSQISIIEDELATRPLLRGRPDTVRRSDTAIRSYIESQAESGCLVIDIHTAHRWWAEQPRIEVVVGRSGNTCRARARVLEAA